VRFRAFRDADAQRLSEIYRQAVEVTAARHYSAAQIAAWLTIAPSADRLRELMADGRTRLVCVDDADRPLAFCDLERDGHLHMLFCAPEAGGQGIATRLVEKAEAAARMGGAPAVRVEASEAARGLFERCGFRLLKRRDFSVAGVPIHNYALEKRLVDSR
jgi:putative acetyltransferase